MLLHSRLNLPPPPPIQYCVLLNKPVLEPGPLDPETSALTTRPPRPQKTLCIAKRKWNNFLLAKRNIKLFKWNADTFYGKMSTLFKVWWPISPEVSTERTVIEGRCVFSYYVPTKIIIHRRLIEHFVRFCDDNSSLFIYICGCKERE